MITFPSGARIVFAHLAYESEKSAALSSRSASGAATDVIPVTSAFCTIQDYSAGVAFVDFELVRNGWEGYGTTSTPTCTATGWAAPGCCRTGGYNPVLLLEAFGGLPRAAPG